jgi:hypothetical protein
MSYEIVASIVVGLVLAGSFDSALKAMERRLREEFAWRIESLKRRDDYS